MLPWQQLNGIEKATEMLYNALRVRRDCGGRDFDADGATSTALSVLSLRAGLR
jgi:single-stranded-DNA-specific exonuclease